MTARDLQRSWVCLPNPPLPPGSDPLQATGRSTKTIAIVEDNADTREIFGMMLRHHGYGVLEAEDGVRGVELVREELPSMVVLDLGLPRLDGWEVAERLRADPRTAAIPILIVTASAEPGGVERALGLGCRSYLTKPLSPRDLVRAVEECVGSADGSGGEA